MNHASSELIAKSNYLEFGIDFRFIKKIIKVYLLFMLD